MDKCKVGLEVVFQGNDSDQRSKRHPRDKKSKLSKSVSIFGIRVTATVDVKGAKKGAIAGAAAGGPVGAEAGTATGAVIGAAKGVIKREANAPVSSSGSSGCCRRRRRRRCCDR